MTVVKLKVRRFQNTQRTTRRPALEVLGDAAFRIAATVAAELYQARGTERLLDPSARHPNRRQRLERLLARVAEIAEDALARPTAAR